MRPPSATPRRPTRLAPAAASGARHAAPRTRDRGRRGGETLSFGEALPPRQPDPPTAAPPPVTRPTPPTPAAVRAAGAGRDGGRPANGKPRHLAPAPAARPVAPAHQPPPPPTVAVAFTIAHRVAYGQSLAVVGSAPALGGWSLAGAVPLAWSPGDVWRATVDLPAGTLVEYKYVVVDGASGAADAWQRGNNSVLAVGDPSSSTSSTPSLELYDNWEGAPGAAVVADGVAGTREGRLAAWAESVSSSLATTRADLRSARLDLAAATADAAAARAEADDVRAALAQAETARAAAVAAAGELRAANAALKAQLADNAAAFRAAMAEVSRLLDDV